jgi:hypothetical protein
VPREFVLETLRGALRTAEPEKALASLFQRPVLVPLHPLLNALPVDTWTAEARALTTLLQQRVAGQLQAESRYFHQRGVLALLGGDIPSAKRWFEHSQRKAPKGWGLPEALGVQESADYLRLIRIAEQRARPR